MSKNELKVLKLLQRKVLTFWQTEQILVA